LPLIRPFAPADQPGILDLILGIQRDEYGIAITAADQPDLTDIAGFYLPGAGGFWVAEEDGRIVGTIALKDIGRGQGALRKMFVASSHRGRAAGVARALLDHLLDAAADRGLAQIYLGTTARFLAAHRFYEKNGFALVDADDLPPDFPRMAVDTRFYERKIEPAKAG
jgi:N-acetylglutamate synthase-like GNAT family acetyltransferase